MLMAVLHANLDSLHDHKHRMVRLHRQRTFNPSRPHSKQPSELCGDKELTSAALTSKNRDTYCHTTPLGGTEMLIPFKVFQGFKGSFALWWIAFVTGKMMVKRDYLILELKK